MAVCEMQNAYVFLSVLSKYCDVMVINFFVGRSRNQFDGSVVESLSVRPSLLVTPWALLNITHENPDGGPSPPPSLLPRQGQTKRKNALPLPLSLLIFPRPLGEKEIPFRVCITPPISPIAQ